MTKQTIEVEGLPEGYRTVAYRYPKNGLELCFLEGQIKLANSVNCAYEQLIVEKIKPRRIVLEEISREEYYRIFNDESVVKIYDMCGSYWREVKETDIPLTNEDVNVKIGVRSSKIWREVE